MTEQDKDRIEESILDLIEKEKLDALNIRAICQLLIDKGIITGEEIVRKRGYIRKKNRGLL